MIKIEQNRMVSTGTNDLQRVATRAPRNAKAALACLACGTAKDFEGSPTAKDAMIQIADFKREHAKCQEATP